MNNSKAFTLIELSMVLIIIAMLIAAVMKSSSIIAQAKAKGVLMEISKLRSYVEEFKVAYNLALPGDMSNAYKYFSDCGLDSAAPTGCNGNGNGNIGFSSYDSGYVESYRFWQHLERAGLLDQSLSGTINTASPYADETNSYNSKAISGAIYFPAFAYLMTDGQFYSNNLKNSNLFVLARPSAEIDIANNKVMSPMIAYNIDLKIDDGKPRVGRIKAYNYYHNVNGYHGTTAGNISGTECDSLGDTNEHSDTVLLAAYYEISLPSEECILLIDF